MIIFTEGQINAAGHEARIIEEHLAKARARKWRHSRKGSILSHQWEGVCIKGSYADGGFVCSRCGVSELEAHAAISPIWCDEEQRVREEAKP